MSHIPPPTYSNVAPEPLPHTSGLAITSLILGILSLLCGWTLVLPILAIILGVMAILRIGRPGGPTGGRGLAIGGIVTACIGVVLIVPLLIAILIPSLGRARELARRAACAANLEKIAQACELYGTDNADAFPTVPYAPYDASKNTVAGTPVAPGGPAANATLFVASSATTDGSPTACVWMLVNLGSVTPRNFECKSDPFFKASAPTESGGEDYNNFATPDSFSYSFAYPWYSDGTVSRGWHNNVDSSIPLASDIAPRNGTGTPPTATDTPALPPSRLYNSINHNREGQNVVFQDGHVAFDKNPYVGQDGDNIFTRQAGATGEPGTPIDGTGPIAVPSPTNSATPVDTVMTPVRDAGNGGM